MSYNNPAHAYIRKYLTVPEKTLFTKEEKAQRKNTIKSYNYMQTRDRVLGIKPTPPPLIVHHPRFFNPPVACKMGLHKWEVGVIMGIPRLKCKKCGRIVMKGSFEGTETKREMRERHIQKPEPLEENFTWVET